MHCLVRFSLVLVNLDFVRVNWSLLEVHLIFVITHDVTGLIRVAALRADLVIFAQTRALVELRDLRAFLLVDDAYATAVIVRPRRGISLSVLSEILAPENLAAHTLLAKVRR